MESHAAKCVLISILLLCHAGYQQVHAKQSDEESKWCWQQVAGAVAGGTAAVAAAPVIITAAGFGAGGIAAGSLAASAMSAAATTGVGVGAVAAAQSIGAAGLGWAGTAVTGAVGGIVGSYFTSGSCEEPDCD